MTNKSRETHGQHRLHVQHLNQQAERLAGLGFWEWDLIEDRLIYCSEGYARTLDMTLDEIMAASGSTEQDHRYIHPDDLQRYAEAEEEAYQ
jgi:hypothetical protein